MHPFLLNTVSGTTLSNPDVYVYMWASPYGWWNQGETFGSQNGLTFMYKVVNLQTGVWGPSKASLSNNIFPTTYQQSIASNDWPGVGADKWTTPFDINWNVAPLNSSTGYFNFTFGNTGHIGYTSVFEIINAHQWIPQRHRVFDANRHYRAIAARGSGLTNSELLVGIPNAFWDPMPTPWVKRKMNFVRKELQNISNIMGACGFYMASASLDDEYYIYGDYNRLGTSTGDTRFYNFYLYPGNTSGGFTWFASYTGSSAAPDSLIQRGITSYRAFLLSHGFTTNTNSSKFVDGLTAIRGGALANNIAASGSAWQTLGLEYKAAVADWVALHFQDYIEDFKRYNGLTSENNNIASYGYYRTDVAVQGYTSDRWGATYSGLLKQLSTDFVSYPDVTPTSAASNARKSAYYGYNILSSGNGGGYVQRERVGDLDSIHCYGAITNYLSIWRGSDYVHSLDRGKLLFGNSYGYGLSHGINFNYYWQYPNSALQAPVWYVPANYLNSGLPGQTFIATKCYELFGITAAMRYDPTGSLGSTRGNATRCSGNSAPQFISWHLNPVWGITQIGTADNYNPANYLPLKGRHMTLGISCGSISLEQLNITRTTNPGATWNLNYFDPSGFPLPGNTLPAGSLYNQYWTHWYPMAFMAFMYDVYWGRQVAANNVYRALGQQQGVIPTVPGSVWNYAQQPIETWITDQKISGGDLTNASAYEATGDIYTLDYNTFVPTGLTYGYFLSSGAVGTTQIVGEQGPMFYEHMRHQYLHKTIRYIDWNIPQYTCTVSATGGQVGVGGGGVALPFVIGGITSFGVCGAITMALARKVNKVVGECNTRAGGLVNQTVFLAPGNMAERSYVLSGAQKAGGGFLWRITFANPATYPSITVRGSETGITTEYRVAGVTDYINNPNNKFGIWWETSALEIPIVENPPIPEALRREIVNLPENSQFQYDATSMVESRNPIDPYYVNNNIRLVCYIEQAPYGHWNQVETWGNQNGLTYCWPNCRWPSGYLGPDKAKLALGQIDWADGSRNIGTSNDWIPDGYVSNYDVDWRTTPWNSSTGYIGFTFGSPGFFSQTSGASQAEWVTRFINTYSWIPAQHRVMDPARSMRALGNGALGGYVYALEKEGSEVCTITMYNSSSGPYQKTFYTPWMKRRANFTRTELRGFYAALKNAGFTMGIFYANDAIGDFSSSIWDFRAIGMTATTGSMLPGSSYFYDVFMYPNNSPTGSTWYAKWDGICAAPDSLVLAGMTSFKSYLLARGFTETAGNWRNIYGLTALANAGISGNIAAGGSVLQFFQQEYYASLVSYFSYYLRDFYNDFKEAFGLTADNSRSSIYGFYKNVAGTYNYLEPGWTRPAPYNYLTGPRTKSSTDYIPYPTNPLTDYDQSVADYYSVLDTFPSQESTKVMFTDLPADISSVSIYGSIGEVANRTNDPSQIDRILRFRGNTYLFANSGKTYGKFLLGNYGYYVQLSRKFASTNPSLFNSIDAAKWFPPGFLGSSLEGATIGGVWKPGALVYFQACSETLGQTGFFRYDPNGTGGSSAANMVKVGSDQGPFFISWHLNPVFGITLSNLSDGRASGPANYIPIYGKEILDGVTYGSYTLRQIRGKTASLFPFGAFDPCGNPYPGLSLPAGSFVNHYWTHWYPLAWMAFLGNVKQGRSVAVTNVATSAYQRKNPNTAERLPGTLWFGVQKPQITWVPHQRWTGDDDIDGLVADKRLTQLWVVPTGITYAYSTVSGTPIARGITFLDAEAGPMYYEAMRHQYLNKTSQFAYWNPFSSYSSTTSFSNTPCIQISGFGPRYFPPSTTSPTLPNGVTFWGTCGAIAMNLTRKINKVVGECDQLGKGIVYETISLDAINMDNREYLASGAQLVDGSYLWRITFAHPATQSPIIVRGSVTGITTAYAVNGVTDYINIPNSKFGVWWTSNYYETPIVENPPVSEAERLNVLNLPGQTAFIYNPFTMTQGELVLEPINAFAWVWPYAWISSGGNWTRSTGTRNLVAYSQDFDIERIGPASLACNTWVRQDISGITLAGITTPTGITALAVRTTTNATSVYHSLRQRIAGLTSGLTYTFSYWTNITRGATGNSFRIMDTTGAGTQPASTTTLREVAINYSSLTPDSAGWARVSTSFNTSRTGNTGVNQIDVYLLSKNSIAGETFYFFGAQLEQSTSAGSYERTSGFKDTRGGCWGATTGTAGTYAIYTYDNAKWANYSTTSGNTFIWPMASVQAAGVGYLGLREGWTATEHLRVNYNQLISLPEGKRGIQPFIMNEGSISDNNGGFLQYNADTITATGAPNLSSILGFTAYPLGITNSPNRYNSPWVDNGIASNVLIMNDFIGGLSANGITSLNFLFGDMETQPIYSFSMRDVPGVTAALVRDSRYTQSWRGLSSWAAGMSAAGMTITQGFNTAFGQNTNDLMYLVWNRLNRDYTAKAWNDAVLAPMVSKYPNLNTLNYDYFISEGGITQAPPDLNGHLQYYKSQGGNIASPVLYGWLGQVAEPFTSTRVDPANPSYTAIYSPSSTFGLTLPWGPWTSVISALQILRSIKRATPEIPVMPWIASVKYFGDNRDRYVPGNTLGPEVPLADVVQGYDSYAGLTFGRAGNSAYYYELIRHIGLHGIKHYLYFNSFSFANWGAGLTGNMYYISGATYHERDFNLLNATIKEVNDKVGGGRPHTLTTSRISWLSDYIVSGSPAATYGYWWRVTVKPGKTMLANGVTLSGTGGTAGTWIWTSGPTLTGVGLTFI